MEDGSSFAGRLLALTALANDGDMEPLDEFIRTHASAIAAVVETTENFMLHPDDAGMMAMADALAQLKERSAQ